MSTTLPPFAYFGGKTTLAPRIVDLLPEHVHYVEPFAGSLAVLLAKRPSKVETVNDIDRHLMTFWRVLRDHPAELIRACSLTPHSRGEYADCRTGYAEPDLDNIERARRVWCALTQGRGGTLTKTGWRFVMDATRTGASLPSYLDGYIDRMPSAAARLHNVSLECRPALDLIADYGKSPTTLLYVDPPYLGSTRTAASYRHEMGSRADHLELSSALHACTATVILSGYRSEIYDKVYADWHRHDLDAFTGQANTNGRRIECLWSNRPLVDLLPLEVFA